MDPQDLVYQIRTMHELQLRCAPGYSNTPRGLVLTHGIGRRCTRDKWCGVRRGRMKQCFQNASSLTIHDPERWIYCEGYAIRRVLGFTFGEHAWVLDRDNDYQVVDPTWRDTRDGLFLGIPFRPEYLFQQLSTNKVYGLLDCGVYPPPMLETPVETWLHPDTASMPRDFDAA